MRRMLARLPVTERRLDLAGTATAVVEAGDGPPLVLLHGGIEPVDRLRLAEPGQVGHDDAVALGEAGDDGRPDRPTALDPTMQEDERRAVTGFDDRGRGAGEVEPPLGDRQSGQHPPHDRRFPSTTGIVWPSTSVGLNSTSSAPA